MRVIMIFFPPIGIILMNGVMHVVIKATPGLQI